MDVSNFVASEALRTAARKLAERKLTGNQLRDAKNFIKAAFRTGRQVEALMARLETVADVNVSAEDRAQLTTLSVADIQRVRADRAAGMTLQQIATKYRIGQTTVWRYCNGPKGAA
jgi:DNA invertase Pin-like site-specific DNA recombinase